MPVSRLTQTLWLALAAAMSEADGAAGAVFVVEAAGFVAELSCATAEATVHAPVVSNSANPATIALRINAPLPDGDGYAINRQHVGCDAIVDVMGLGESNHIVEGLDHDGFELFVDNRLLPEIALAVLYPFKVGRGDATGVTQDVGDDEDSLVGEDFVGGCGGGAVGAFGQDLALHAIGVTAGDLIFGGSGNQDLAFGEQEFGGIDFFGAGESGDGAVLLAMFAERLYVDAILVVEAAIDFENADDLVAGLCHEQRGVGADVAETLHDDTGGFFLKFQFLDGFIADDHDAAAGGFAAAARSPHVDGLASHDGGDGLAHVHGIGVHHPGHGLFVGIDVGRGNVFFGADELK